MPNKRKAGYYILLLIAVASLILAFYSGPIPQNPSYHEFSDTIIIFGIPNALNVLSNLPFLLVGILGVWKIRELKSNSVIIENRIAYQILFFAIALVAFGSGYYHLWPENNTLLWDRLPMTLAFMSLFSIVISEFISIRWGSYLLFPLLISGLMSVTYWHFTELNGIGDLRWYGLVQFYPMLAIPVILVLFPPSFTKKSAFWWVIFAYFLAKILEYYDHFFHSLLSVISGHSLKHIVAAIGLYVLVRAFENRDRHINR